MNKQLELNIPTPLPCPHCGCAAPEGHAEWCLIFKRNVVVHNEPGIGLSLTHIRPALASFVAAMEEKLKKNDHKTGWRDLPIDALSRLMMLELEEYKVARDYFSVDEARKELVDVANFVMMLWDRLSLEQQND